ncbi:phage portal protein [Paenibacillus larvae]|uniref:Portal protein n=5 Tax=root TaxID=1 RepID=A0A0C5ABR2_9CAUD|nr:phage portal protein [Paenibacillus larvae]YP_009197948.1 portal protein [Paenibacillus phage Diva]YP_009203448.1 portal protein [Paenibacillus phage Sitara]YP_009224869.1 portal protein [Paenibacillus phage Rani]YP_009598526.1 portal protein [Paenibacillus phage Shelly]QVV19477.1 portal protein [Paenibacillus phage Bohemia]QVV19550.1 portal protein [Paenibacillus phage Fitz]QVV19615.1 portal protein [Paenibacillus phage Gohan]QVV19683.1 portal protein [Paenibacillus phage Hobie]QVV1980
MKWFGKMKSAVRGAISGWKGGSGDFSTWFGRRFWGIDNTKLATNETIFSVVSRLANALSCLPLKLYKDYDIQMNETADMLIHHPNSNMSGFEWLNKMEVSRNETGNGYAVIMRDIRLQPEALIPIDPVYVTPILNQDDGHLWYEVRGIDGTYYLHNMNMFHVKHITGAARWKGISPIEVLKNTLEYDKAVQEFSLSEMQKKDSFILEYGASVDTEKRQRIVDDFKRFYKENGGILFQEPGVTVTNMERKYVASDTLASEKITRSRVANVFNLPVNFLNEEGQGSHAEQMMIQFVQMTLTPTVRQYEQEMNRKLLTSEERQAGYYFKFNLGALLRGDTAARTQFYQMMLRSAGMKPDEVRMYEDLPPEGGKAAELWISGDMYPLNMDPAERKGVKERGETKKEHVLGDEDVG